MNTSLPQMVLARCERDPAGTALKERAGGKYRCISRRELHLRIRTLAAALLSMKIQKGDRVAILGPNGPHWVTADLGALLCGAITVPIYHNDSLSATFHILEDSEACILFCHSTATALEILQQRQRLPELQTVITMDGEGPSAGLKDISELLGTVPPEPLDERTLLGRIDSGHPATLVYTSGTTGKPKGVYLSHGNMISNIEACAAIFPLDERDCCLSFLPLAHVFERMAGYYFMLSQGVTIAYAESLATVPRDMRDINPTVIISVPRLFEKIFDRIQLGLRQSGELKQSLFNHALELSLARWRRELQGLPPTEGQRFLLPLAEQILFRKIRNRLAGNLRFFVSGGAPLRLEIAQFFLGIGLPIYEGYGLTETSPVIAANRPGAHRPGTVGRPLVGTEVRIAEDGEILARGPGIFTGYRNRPAETEAALANGWFHTGDIGELTAEGYLRITDRKKDLIVTAGGENIAPQNIEAMLKDIPLISSALVYGDRRPYLSALIAPELDQLRALARKLGQQFQDDCELVSAPAILSRLRDLIDERQKSLPSIERVKRFTLLSRDFSQDSNEVTPTLKLKRPVICQRFSSVIEGMYGAQDQNRHDAGLCVIEELSPDEE